jgi:phage protein D
VPPSSTSAAKIEVTCAGAVDQGKVHGFIVRQDLGQADACELQLNNDGNTFSNEKNPGDAVEVKVNDVTIFKGEVVGVDAYYKAGGESKCVIQCYNKMHRLLRGRKTMTWKDKSDQDIVKAIVSAAGAGLSAEVGSSPTIVHKHMFQHNQPDLEFIRLRAACLGYEVWCWDTTLYFKAVDLNEAEVATLELNNPDQGSRLKSFAGRLSTAMVAKQVIVRGWDPEKKEKIEKTASIEDSRLGSGNSGAAGSFGEAKVYTVDRPIYSPDEAEAIAKARMGELVMNFMTGEGEAVGNPALRAGKIVKLVVNKAKNDDRYNGKWVLDGLTHRYSHSKDGNTGGFNTAIRVKRDMQKGT